MEARTLPAANYFDPAADTVANVTTVGAVSGDTKQTADVATLIATVGVAGAGLTAADDAVLAAIGALNNLSAAGAQAAAAAALAAYGAALETTAQGIHTKTTNLPSDPADESQVEAAIAASQAVLIAQIIASSSTGTGALLFVYTVIDSATLAPLDGVRVWVTTTNDASETPPRASGTTDAFGDVSLMLDPGWYYFWKQLAGWDAPTADYLEVS
jgi:hypothetical protein